MCIVAVNCAILHVYADIRILDYCLICRPGQTIHTYLKRRSTINVSMNENHLTLIRVHLWNNQFKDNTVYGPAVFRQTQSPFLCVCVQCCWVVPKLRPGE